MKLFIKVISKNPFIKKFYEEKVKQQNEGGCLYYDSGVDLIFPEDHYFLKFKKKNVNGFINYNLYRMNNKDKTILLDNFVSREEIITELVDLGIQCAAFTDEGEPCGYYLYPRSSIFKTPFRMANSIGIIDSGYRGNIKVPLDLIVSKINMRNMLDGDTVHTSYGERMFQICAGNLEKINIELVDELPDTQRGSNGFGSTGK